MNFDDFWKRSVTFGLTLALGLFAAAFFYEWALTNVFRKERKPAPQGVSITNNTKAASGAGHARCYTDIGKRCFPEMPPEPVPSNLAPLKITSKPRAAYTDAARANNVQGKVVLRVTFLADGQIGAISTVSGLPDGLTEAAIEAAKGIKFDPARKGVKPVTVKKTVEYTFTIY